MLLLEHEADEGLLGIVCVHRGLEIRRGHALGLDPLAQVPERQRLKLAPQPIIVLLGVGEFNLRRR